MESPDSILYQKNEETTLEGEIGGTPTSSDGAEYHTLDEPVKDTIARDLKAVGTKFYHVLYPKEKKTLLKDWDLWGPLILCMLLASLLSTENADDMDDNGLQFAQIFFIVWFGAIVVTVNSKLLGGNISFFQSVCVLGYCLLAPSIALIMCKIMGLIFNYSLFLFISKLLLVTCGFSWAIVGVTVFLGDTQLPKRKALAVYPIFLFYFVVSWMILASS
ncbi:protein YIPF6 [Parasteatoda tepidariorum]|uniref:protein YIPF6 n=1 Tax=Parasteatoda tepidariorum TaxID=114398 RepID=UPI00077FB295|nr:protein YIPF6 [Parasteatoda tepidariorum]